MYTNLSSIVLSFKVHVYQVFNLDITKDMEDIVDFVMELINAEKENKGENGNKEKQKTDAIKSKILLWPATVPRRRGSNLSLTPRHN